eukprot:TRINITY_DN67144_c4_g3_i1.p4 TRINITY_DN67144_c4_g3~~TRINITY_DN67144_c4_g3_i1.p4  ORF type:complete len:141 (-),score=78.23 TRINITY_DN67144_c4_g3_i1:322-744(-)
MTGEFSKSQTGAKAVQKLDKKRLMLYCAAIFMPFAMMGFVRQRTKDVYVFRQVRSQLPNNAVLRKLLGGNVTVGKKYRGVVNRKLVNFSVDVEGPSARGVMRVQGMVVPTKQSWNITEATVTVAGRGSRIDVPLDKIHAH